jgi:TusA-related sulfurtransferase
MTMSEEIREVTLDIRGQVCPSTLLTALKEINARCEALRGGREKLVVLTTNRDSTHTLPDAARNMGYHVEVSREDGHYRIVVHGSRP